MHGAGGTQKLAVGADVNIPSFLPTEVRARESAIRSFALVANRNMRRDPAPDEPAEEAACPIGRVGQKPLRLQGETLLRSIEHRLGGFNLIIGAGRRRF